MIVAAKLQSLRLSLNAHRFSPNLITLSIAVKSLLWLGVTGGCAETTAINKNKA
jgi:hypothetical protein